jgi:amyloid beta precursor protein binding protein 1
MKRLVIINQYGLINYLRIFENYHANIKLNDKDKNIRDTRVGEPFAELVDFSDKIELDKMTEIDHKHIPYVVLLIKALKIYKEKFNKNPNATKNNKDQFKDILFSMKKYNDEENFEEALKFFYDVTIDYLEVIFFIFYI